MNEFTSRWLSWVPKGEAIIIHCFACQGDLSPYLDMNDDGGFDLGLRCSGCHTVWFGLDKVTARRGVPND